MATSKVAMDIGLPEATRPRASCGVVEDLEDLSAFARVRDEWNGLVDASDPQPFYRHEYIKAFVTNFLQSAALKVVTVRDASGRLTAALPLASGRGSICGVPTRERASPTNVHSLRFDLVAAEGGQAFTDEAAQTVFQHLVADQSWDVLKLTDIPEGGKAWRLYEAAQAAGFPVGAWESHRSPYIELPDSQEILMKSLSAKFRGNLRRRRKRLAENGEITVERLFGPTLTQRHLEEALVMESGGWKGRQGSAVNQSEATRGFHRELFLDLAYRERLSLFRLKLQGQPIAFQYGITTNGVFSLVMTSYDESFSVFSPGHLLTEEVLKDCVSRGLREFDFLGCDLPWKLEWTSAVRAHHWLFIFRDSARGRLLRKIKFSWAQTARQLLTKWRMHLQPDPRLPKEAA